MNLPIQSEYVTIPEAIGMMDEIRALTAGLPARLAAAAAPERRQEAYAAGQKLTAEVDAMLDAEVQKMIGEKVINPAAH